MGCEKVSGLTCRINACLYKKVFRRGLVGTLCVALGRKYITDEEFSKTYNQAKLESW